MEARVTEGREESAPLVDGEGVRWPVHSFWGCEIVTARSMVSWVTMWEIDIVLSSKKILMISNEFMTTADIAFTTVAPPHPAFSLVRASVHTLLS
jgi:hypothetical protein